MSMINDITAGLASKRSKRKGRGESSGKGKTCGKGNKGAQARGGGPYWKPGHEGGQTPIHRRLPKRGFSNDPFVSPFLIVNLGELEVFDNGATVDTQALVDKHLLDEGVVPVKILGDGTLTKKLTIKASWYTKSALARIAELGGEALNLKGEKFELPKPKKKFVKREQPKKAKEEQAKPAEAKAEEAKK